MARARHRGQGVGELGPEKCEYCELSATAWIYVTYNWGGSLERHVCADCVDTIEYKLRQERGVDVVVQYDANGPMYGWGT